MHYKCAGGTSFSVESALKRGGLNQYIKKISRPFAAPESAPQLYVRLNGGSDQVRIRRGGTVLNI